MIENFMMSAGISPEHFVFAGEMIVFLIFLGIAWRHKSSLVALLTLIQMGGVIYENFFSGHHLKGQVFFSDYLSIIMMLVINVVGGIIVLYAIRYMKDHEHHLGLTRTKQPQFFFYMLLFLVAMNGLVFANQLSWLAFFWEITTLCCFALIAHDGTEIAIKNALWALKLNLLGGVAMTFAILLLGHFGFPTDLQGLLAQPGAKGALFLLPIGLLCFTGFTKSAQVPFQSWLLGAMVAPTPVSALLHSSTMVKAGVYLVLRLAPAYQGTHLSQFVALVGALSFLVSAALAIGQTNAKKVLAYSTISNLGLIILCAGLNTPLSMAAALLVLVFHAASKGLLFMCAGAIEHITGSREIEDMESLMSRNPAAATITILGILMMFMPPAGMLIGKWVAIEASESFLPLMIILTLGSALTAVYWAKWAGKLLLGSPSYKEEPKPLAFGYTAPLVVLLSLAVLMSIFIVPLTNQLVSPEVHSMYFADAFTTTASSLVDQAGTWNPIPIFLFLIPLILILLYVVGVRKPDLRPVYLCGENVDQPWGDEKIRFRCLGEEEVKLGGFYFTNLVKENTLTKYANVIGVLLLVILVGVTLL